jgi:hypothetical protein
MTRLRGWLTPLLFLCGGILLAHHSMILSRLSLVQADLGDARLVHYLLEHDLRWALRNGAHADLWSPPFFFPQRGHLAWSENMVGAMPVYALWRGLGLSELAAFQLWILTQGALSFAAVHLLLRHPFRLSRLAASLGAALFAFSAVRLNQAAHAQLYPQCFSVIAIYAAARLFDGTADTPGLRRRWIALFFVAMVWQLWAAVYLGWFLVFALVVAGVVGLLFAGGRQTYWTLLRHHPVMLLACAALSAAALYPLASAYLEAAKTFGGRSFAETLLMIPRPSTWLHMGDPSWFYGWLAKRPPFTLITMEHEQRIGFGFVTTAVAIAGFAASIRQAALRAVGLVTLLLILVSSLYGSFTPWEYVYQYFPGAQGIRGVSRLFILYMLGVCIGAAAFVDWLARKRGGYAIAAAILALVCVVEQGVETRTFDRDQNERDIRTIAAAVGADCQHFVFSPIGGTLPGWKYSIDAMWASLERGVPTLNGYSGQRPPGWSIAETNLLIPADAQRVQDAVSAWGRHAGFDASRVCWVQAALDEGTPGAELVRQEVPARMVAGDVTTVKMVWRNTSTRTWRPRDGIRLGAPAGVGAPWGIHRARLPGAVAPGETALIEFQIRAPAEPGFYPFRWRMVHEGVEWFGAYSPYVAIDVRPSSVD